MNETLARFAQAPLPDLPPPSAGETKAGFFLPDAFTNPEHLHYAVKTTTAAMFCYITITLLDWPGIHTALITCYIVSLGTTAETVEKLALRILGCLLGAAGGIAAIVFLMPDLTSIGGLMAVVFLATIIAGWVAAGSPRIAYAGFQIAFAFFLCVIQGSSPAFDMVTARDRVIGILFGNLVVYLIFSNVWPVTMARRIDTGMAGLLRRLATMTLATNRSQRYSMATEASAALGEVERDLKLARYEPASLRPTTDWLDVRRRILESIAGAMGPLWLHVNQNPSLRGELSRRLGKLAESLGGRIRPQAESPAAGAASDAANVTDVPIVDQFQDLERALAVLYAEEGIADYVPI